MVVARGWGERKWGVVYGVGVSVWGDEKVLEMEVVVIAQKCECT